MANVPTLHGILKLKLVLFLHFSKNSSSNFTWCMTPIGTCQAERSFSVLKRIKTNLPSTMTEERLTGLTMMSKDHAECLLLQMETVARQFV